MGSWRPALILRNPIFEFFIQQRTLSDLCLMALTSIQASVEAPALLFTGSPHHVSSQWHVVELPTVVWSHLDVREVRVHGRPAHTDIPPPSLLLDDLTDWGLSLPFGMPRELPSFNQHEES